MKEPNVYAGLNAMSEEVHRIAQEHGWWDGDTPFERIALMCHSEISEAVEEYRNGMPPAYVFDATADALSRYNESIDEWAPEDKPEGVAVEMADCLIRLLDWFGAMGYDLEAIVRAKCAYNETRPYRHGGKQL